MQTTDTLNEDWIDCLPSTTDVTGKITAAFHKKWTQKMCRKQITLSKNERLFCNNSVQSEQNKPISGHIHSTKKKKTAKLTSKHDWTRFVLNLCQLKLRTCPTIFGWNFFFFANKSVMQTAQLNDSSPMEHFETAVKCMIHSAYFESYMCKRRER